MEFEKKGENSGNFKQVDPMPKFYHSSGSTCSYHFLPKCQREVVENSLTSGRSQGKVRGKRKSRKSGHPDR